MRWLVIGLASLGAGLAFADKFEVDGLYYEIVSDCEVEFTFKGNYPSLSTAYSGDIVIPDSISYQGETYLVTSIGQNACSGPDISSVSIPVSVKTLQSFSFASCSSLTSISIPDSVTDILTNAFYECQGLSEVYFGSSVKYIGASSFFKCDALTEVVLPSSVETIDYAAFRDCSHLRRIVIGNNIKSIGEVAFKGCSDLSLIILTASIPPTASDNSFDESAYVAATLDVPQESRELYCTSPVWRNFSSISTGIDTFEYKSGLSVSVIENYNLSGIKMDQGYRGIKIEVVRDGRVVKFRKHF